MKNILASVLLALAALQAGHAQTGAILGATTGAAAAALIPGSNATKLAWGVGTAVVGGVLGHAYDTYAADKAAQTKLDDYLLGRYQEGYIEAFSPWYKATLEPTTGRPPAFDGYWAMDIGTNNPGILAESPAQIATDRQRYEASLSNTPAPLANENDPAKPAATSVVTSRIKHVNGVDYAPKKVVYPRLPALQP